MRTTLVYAALYIVGILIWGAPAVGWGLIILPAAWALTLVLFAPRFAHPDPHPAYSPLDKMDGRI